MEVLFKVVLGFLGVSAVLFLSPLLGVIAGSFVGWVVSITFFESWIKDALHSFGVMNVNLTCLGALLGFVGGFFRSSSKS